MRATPRPDSSTFCPLSWASRWPRVRRMDFVHGKTRKPWENRGKMRISWENPRKIEGKCGDGNGNHGESTLLSKSWKAQFILHHLDWFGLTRIVKHVMTWIDLGNFCDFWTLRKSGLGLLVYPLRSIYCSGLSILQLLVVFVSLVSHQTWCDTSNVVISLEHCLKADIDYCFTMFQQI